jgi:multiple sugar transport system ATP-binding protein
VSSDSQVSVPEEGIVLREVAKTFGTVDALLPLDLTVPPGSFLALLGPSGCGKTTTLRIVAGLETPTSGSVTIAGRDVTNLEPKDRDIAMVFQNYALYPHLSVRENIGYPLRARRMKKIHRDQLIERVATALDLGSLLDRRPKQLSGGQRQRVALGRAMVRKPAAFLMDEPLSNLDAKLRVQMRAELKHLHRELGVTTVYVTHDQIEATTMADAVAVMNQGRLEQLASPHALYEQPANTFVASFIGSPPMNLLSVQPVPEGLHVGEGRKLLPLDRADAAELLARSGGERLTIGMRPEAIQGPVPPDQGMPASVFAVQPLEHELLVTFAVEQSVQLIGRFPSGAGFAMGDDVHIGVAVDRLHLFHHETGEALAGSLRRATPPASVHVA